MSALIVLSAPHRPEKPRPGGFFFFPWRRASCSNHNLRQQPCYGSGLDSGAPLSSKNAGLEIGMMCKRAATAATLAAVVALGACQTARFGGPAPVASAGPVYNTPEMMEDGLAAPSGEVTAQPLPPPGADPYGAGPVVADVPSIPAPTYPQATAVARGGRSSVVGGWTAREAAGGTCRVQLSSTPALDLYRASTAGCGNRDLARVSAWDYRDGEVYLYQPGGAVTARLRTSGGAMEGALAKSGAPLTLSR